MRLGSYGESAPWRQTMRIILEDRKGRGLDRDFKRVERADKRDIRRRRKAKLSRLRLSGAIVGGF